MRSKATEMYNKVLSILQETPEHITAKKLAQKTNLSIGSIYKIISIMRDNGIGVIPRHRQGYILAEFASQQDDVHFARRLNSQFARNVVAMQSAAPHILKRWKGKTEFKFFSEMTSRMLPSSVMLQKNTVALLGISRKLGI